MKGPTGDWYVHLGADGRSDDIGVREGRSIGLITAEVVPTIIGVRGEARVMIRGVGSPAGLRGPAPES